MTCAPTETFERADRLVEDEEARAQGEGARDVDALALATAELVRIAREGGWVEADRVEQFAEARGQAFRRRLAVDSEGLGENLLNGHARVERGVGVLEDDLHAAAQVAHGGGGGGRKGLALEDDNAGGGFDQAQQYAGDGGLAAAGFADQAERFAGLDGERHIVHDAGDAVAARVLLNEAAGLDERERSCAGLSCEAAGELGHRRNGSIHTGLNCAFVSSRKRTVPLIGSDDWYRLIIQEFSAMPDATRLAGKSVLITGASWGSGGRRRLRSRRRARTWW